jgi:hypothetical protein
MADGGGEGSESPSNKRKFYWKDIEVPHKVHVALTTQWRGQIFGKDAERLMNLFQDLPELTQKVDGVIQCKGNVSTKLVCKYDSTFTRHLGFGAINPGKLLKVVLNNENVPDQVRFRISDTNG